MLRSSLLLCLLTFFFPVEGQEILPPGVARVDAMLIDVKEITNLNWLEYLHYLRQDSSMAVYKAALPDTTVWQQVYDDELAMAFTANYLRGPAFRYFPVVGVTYEQATSYCQWRSVVVTLKMNPYPRQDIQITYRLPTPSEWQTIAQNTVSYSPMVRPENLDKMRFQRSNLGEIKKRSGYDFSIRKLRKSIIAFYQRNLVLLLENLDTEEEYEFKPYLGIGHGPKKSMQAGRVNDLRGNVSEMTALKGTAMGGNWSTTFDESPVYRRFIYQGPSPVLGFRCICEIRP